MNGVETLPSLSPAFFFNVRCPLARSEDKKGIERQKFKLPHYSWLMDEDPFADVYMSWNEQGIGFVFAIHKPFEESRYPQFEEGDSVEVFLDTRDTKEATYANRFCHHFVVLPAEVQGVRALEITRLRADDKRALCDPEDIAVETEFSKKSYTLRIGLPANCLYGFDPAVCPRLGFTYRINRATGPNGRSQHFSVSSRSCALAQFPALWATMDLENVEYNR